MKRIAVKTTITAFIILVGILTCIKPLYPNEQFLQHLGSLLLISILAIDLKRDRLKISSFICLSLLIIIHIIGARYIYSYVPYNEWFKTILHVDVTDLFQSDRNHYDRFVHLMFGMLIFPYLFQITGRDKALKKMLRIFIVLCIIQTISMLYEVFEWLLTLVMSNEAANDYNGQQGDVWDAQKDMALAMLGSIIMAVLYMMKKEVKE